MKTCSIPDPVKFRAQCTGIGYTREASEMTGRARAQRVIDNATPEQQKRAVGYPAPSEFALAMAVAFPMRRATLRR